MTSSQGPHGAHAHPATRRGGAAAQERAEHAAAFFDLDKTIIATSSATAFSRGFLAGGLLTRRSVARSAYAQVLYLLGGADAGQTERLRVALSRAVTGWDVAQVSEIVERTLHESIDAAVYAEAVALIDMHHAAGHDVIVVSASGAEIVRPIAALLGADHVIATRMSVVDGRYTGEIDFYAYGENKATAIRELAAERGYDLDSSYAYSDSITDAPMLAAVGHASAVNPDRTLRRLAAEQGWDVLTFSRPVALRTFLRPEPSLVAGLGLAALAALALLLLWKRRRATAAVSPCGSASAIRPARNGEHGVSGTALFFLADQEYQGVTTERRERTHAREVHA